MTVEPSKARRAPRRPTDEQRAGALKAIALLDEWMADESGYDEEMWPQIQAALERDRLSSRSLFDG